MVIHSHKPVPAQDPVTQISAHLAPELLEVHNLLSGIGQSESPLIREVGEYICLTSGKKLRPMMVLLCERAFTARIAEPATQIAAAMEVIHIATLLHDDVIDKAPLRRGKPSVNARWGDDVAILMADYLFASSFDLALHRLDNAPLRLICQVTRRMSEGEMHQIERRGQWLTGEDYLSIIQNKTAHLFSACCALGALDSNLGPEELARVAAFGLNFGMAFQITDDALDYAASDDHWGKSVGIDLAAGKQTLPLILTMQSASPEDREKIERLLGNGRDIRQMSEFFERYRALERCLDLAREYARQAARNLAELPIVDEVAGEYLQALTEYVVKRQF